MQEKPGAFFFLGTGQAGKPMGLHESKMNFNDDMVGSGGLFWVRLAEERLGVKLLKE